MREPTAGVPAGSAAAQPMAPTRRAARAPPPPERACPPEPPAPLPPGAAPAQKVVSVLDMVRSPSLPYAAVFDLPLASYFFWVFPDYSAPYKDTYELAAYLLQKYQGTGKQVGAPGLILASRALGFGEC